MYKENVIIWLFLIVECDYNSLEQTWPHPDNGEDKKVRKKKRSVISKIGCLSPKGIKTILALIRTFIVRRETEIYLMFVLPSINNLYYIIFIDIENSHKLNVIQFIKKIPFTVETDNIA